MGLGLSILLMAVGAVLTFAVEVDSTEGFNINTAGVVLMVVGAIGILLSLIFWTSWGGYRGRRVVEEERL
jgi:hypothetical protein